nr:unnamed protein product [Callosobruchus chinensis]
MNNDRLVVPHFLPLLNDTAAGTFLVSTYLDFGLPTESRLVFNNKYVETISRIKLRKSKAGSTFSKLSKLDPKAFLSSTSILCKIQALDADAESSDASAGAESIFDENLFANSSESSASDPSESPSESFEGALTESEIIEEHSISEVIKHMCCRSSEVQLNAHCLERSCQGCRENMMNITNSDETGLTSYETWITKRVELIIKGEKKSCMKTIKELKGCSKAELLNVFKKSIYTFMRHVCNVSHQFRTIKYLKENLSDTECFLHMDFSENYNCKYAE